MSDWFRSVPHALDAIAYAAKVYLCCTCLVIDLMSRIQFQQQSMASQIQHYKARHQQQRGYIDKLRREIVDLKKYV
jgi:hypothetical protein